MKTFRLTAEILESREFYDTLRNEVAPQMTLVIVCDDGNAYYWEDYVEIMLLVGEHFVALSYAGGPGPSEWINLMRECALAVGNRPDMDRLSRLFNFYASVDPLSNEFTLHGYGGSDWTGIYPRAKRGSMRRAEVQKPWWWPENYRPVIEALNSNQREN